VKSKLWLERRRALARAWRNISPMRLLEAWDASYWESSGDVGPCDDGWEPNITWRFRLAALAYRWIERLNGVRHVCGDWGADDVFPYGRPSWHCEVFLRWKACVCLLLALEPAEDTWRLDDVPVVFYDLESYGTQDGPGGCCDEVHVGCGVFRNWFAHIVKESWP
jgi:hypothetical protein